MKKTKTEMLSEVIANVTTKGRCLVDGEHNAIAGCLYWNQSLGYGCAIGNFLKPEYKNDEFAINNNGSIDEVLRDCDYNILQEEYDTKDLEFLVMLQDLHDTYNYWDLINENLVLNSEGKDAVNNILEYIEEVGNEL